MVKIRFHKKMEAAYHSRMELGGMWWNYFGYSGDARKLDLSEWPHDDLIELCSALKSIVDR